MIIGFEGRHYDSDTTARSRSVYYCDVTRVVKVWEVWLIINVFPKNSWYRSCLGSYNCHLRSIRVSSLEERSRVTTYLQVRHFDFIEWYRKSKTDSDITTIRDCHWPCHRIVVIMDIIDSNGGAHRIKFVWRIRWRDVSDVHNDFRDVSK